MAHTCPVCGAYCNCNGDIDDICLDLEDDINACTCCCDDLDDLDNDYEDDDYPYDDEVDESEPIQLLKLGCKCAHQLTNIMAGNVR